MLAAAGLVANPKIFEISLISPVLCPMLLLSRQAQRRKRTDGRFRPAFAGRIVILGYLPVLTHPEKHGRIPTRTVIWAAGVAASPLGKSLGVPLDRAGRVIVNPIFRCPAYRTCS